jgi:hypothetical protein
MDLIMTKFFIEELTMYAYKQDIPSDRSVVITGGNILAHYIAIGCAGII